MLNHGQMVIFFDQMHPYHRKSWDTNNNVWLKFRKVYKVFSILSYLKVQLSHIAVNGNSYLPYLTCSDAFIGRARVALALPLIQEVNFEKKT